MRNKKVCVFGDVMLDSWVKCNPVKVSPEAPVLVCKYDSVTYSPGGAGNVAANLRSAFNCNVQLVGLVSEDNAGCALIECLNAHGIKHGYMVEDPAWVTIEKRRFVDGLGRHLLRLDTEIENPEVPEAIQANLNAHLHVASQECDTLVISDYGKGTVTAALARCAIQEARDRGKYVIVNGKPDRLLNYRNASLLVYNLAEAQAAWYKFGDGGDPYEPSDLAGALYKVINAHGGLTEVLITCGDRGMVLWTATGSRVAEAVPVKVADVTGAGDVTVATIASLGYCNLDVMHDAAVNAAEVVAQHGTSICARKDSLNEEHLLMATLWPSDT